MDLDGVVSRIWSIPTTWRAKVSCKGLWAETCMLARVFIGDDSWSSWWHEMWLLGTSYMVDLETLWSNGVTTMMMTWWQHLGMGWAETQPPLNHLLTHGSWSIYNHGQHMGDETTVYLFLWKSWGITHINVIGVSSLTWMWQIESQSLMRWSLHVEEMDFLQMDHDVRIDTANFMQHIDTKQNGLHIADEMEATSWTWAWLILVSRWILDLVDDVMGC